MSVSKIVSTGHARVAGETTVVFSEASRAEVELFSGVVLQVENPGGVQPEVWSGNTASLSPEAWTGGTLDTPETWPDNALSTPEPNFPSQVLQTTTEKVVSLGEATGLGEAVGLEETIGLSANNEINDYTEAGASTGSEENQLSTNYPSGNSQAWDHNWDHNWDQKWDQKVDNQHKIIPTLHSKKILNAFLSLTIALSLVVAIVVFLPVVYFKVFPADVIELQATDEGSAFGGKFRSALVSDGNGTKGDEKSNGGGEVDNVGDAGETEGVESKKSDSKAKTEPVVQHYLPPTDPTLPDGDWLVIPRIGVRTKLQKTATANEALETGVWWVPDFGNPGYDNLPMILAGHRFGWKWWWRDEYWKYNSFYLLPDTEPGDRVEIISDHRKWIYEIYAGTEGDEITDYSADLILYTCKYLTSPIRFFRYARIIDPNTNTQAR